MAFLDSTEDTERALMNIKQAQLDVHKLFGKAECVQREANLRRFTVDNLLTKSAQQY